MHKCLVALPVYNEARYLDGILEEVCKYASEVLVVNDGSTDQTSQLLSNWPQVQVVHHPANQGYGAALKSAFSYSIQQRYDCLVTLDCDGQHQPQRIPHFIQASQHADIVSGSRYLKKYEGDSQPPSDRMNINFTITQELNSLLHLDLTDAFCGFKAYQVAALERLDIQDNGYAMPLEVWVQATMLGMRIIEEPVPLIYLDLSRSFGGALDDGQQRLRYYRQCIDRSIAVMQQRGHHLPNPQSSLSASN
jgi:glycosyltransferase involved in cell wall biosynthesis